MEKYISNLVEIGVFKVCFTAIFGFIFSYMVTFSIIGYNATNIIGSFLVFIGVMVSPLFLKETKEG